ncbi:MAG: molybdopterin-dependent oxidoreductase [Gammaproteobacteria bacterium]|nr:molybdopterin-dependent oxidoreductase [Gammaproteobacteria bacterium]
MTDTEQSSQWQQRLFKKQECRTTCPYCGVGCGIVVNTAVNTIVNKDKQGELSIKGDPDHPANYGRLCSKGSALLETIDHQGRLKYPKIDGQKTDWDKALKTIANRFKQVINDHGSDAVAFYVSGQLMTEDYYVANKLMKGFIGSANIDTNSRLCMSSAVAAYKRAFGEDVVPCQYEDLERAKLIVLTGSNTAWCHPVIYQRIVKAKKENPDLMIVVIDPRKTQTTSVADLYLPLKPGTDAFLFNGLLKWLLDNDEHNVAFTNSFTQGMEETLAQVETSDIDSIADICGLELEDLTSFYKLFARTERTVTVFSQGINQSSTGTDKGNAIINCHLLTGRIGRPGMGPFSITGQPNAMGGREVGGLSNQLAAHLDINSESDRNLVQSFWGSSIIAQKEGLKAVDLFDAMEQGKIKAVWIMATNPAVSLPDSQKVRSALKKCDLVVVSDCMEKTDTTELADIVLPAITWGERDGTVTNSERCISRQRSFLKAPKMARPDWWIISKVAGCMGYGEHFKYEKSADIFKEHCQLSAHQNDGSRVFNLKGLIDLDSQEYDQMPPTYWPVLSEIAGGEKAGDSKNRVYSNGQFSHSDKKAHFIKVVPELPTSDVTEQYPYRLNTGRVRDHWHTMTRTGQSSRLSSHIIEPFVQIHPDDAKAKQINQGDLVKISSPLTHHNSNEEAQEIYVKADISDKQQKGSIFVPIHWTDQFSSNSIISSLVPSEVDPISGQPESKHAIANIEACEMTWYAFVISRNEPELKYAAYWSKSRGKGHWRYELAGHESPDDWPQHIKKIFNHPIQNESWIELYDKKKQHYRAIRMQGQQLETCVFIDSKIQLPPRDWLISLFNKEQLSDQERAGLLSANPVSENINQGKVICSCFNVAEQQIIDAIAKNDLKTVEEIGALLQAGTNCGSCKPELEEFL